MSQVSFRLSEWGARGEALLTKAKETLGRVENEDVQALATRVPESLNVDGPPCVVFAGQYGAGKSSLLKILTGLEEIETGEGIVTGELHRYRWAGIDVLDTPGIHTRLRPDHDAISYEAIAGADLIVFVITNELMDSHIAHHFRNLAIDRDKGHELMLVVNKMDRTALGNTAKMRRTITDDLRKVLGPELSPEQVRLCFVSAELAEESRKCEETDEAEETLEESGFPVFIKELNRFVEERGTAGKLTTNLYELEHVLQQALAGLSTGDVAIDGMEEVLLQKRRHLLNARRDAGNDVRGRVGQSTEQIRREGREISGLIHAGVQKGELDSRLESGQKLVEQITEQLQEAIEGDLAKVLDDLSTQLSELEEGEFYESIRPLLENAVNIVDVNVDPELLQRGLGVAKGGRALGEFLLKNAFNSEKSTFFGLMKLRQYSGTNVHSTVKTVGKFFGKKFKPWEAVKMTRTIANLGRGLVVLGAIGGVVLELKADADSRKQERELRQLRAQVRQDFNDVSNTIELHYDKELQAYSSEFFEPEIAAVDGQLAELRRMLEFEEELHEMLHDLLEETNGLIREIHECLPGAGINGSA